MRSPPIGMRNTSTAVSTTPAISRRPSNLRAAAARSRCSPGAAMRGGHFLFVGLLPAALRGGDFFFVGLLPAAMRGVEFLFVGLLPAAMRGGVFFSLVLGGESFR